MAVILLNRWIGSDGKENRDFHEMEKINKLSKMKKLDKKIHVALIVGARPNFIKAAPLLRVMKRGTAFFPRLVHTGQHYQDEMSKIFFKQLRLPDPDVHLNQKGNSPSRQIAEIILALEKDFQRYPQDLVVVFGDVNSTLAASIAANKLDIPLAHVESGLRSFDRTMPEEHNRLITDALADYLFTPSTDANENLLREGISKDRIFFVGNIMVDSLLAFQKKASNIKKRKKLGLEKGQYALVTLHRPSNVDNATSMEAILSGLQRISEMLPIVFPVHPRTKNSLRRSSFFHSKGSKQFVFSPPLSYLDFLSLMIDAKVVITDSGGIQEETTVLGVPCLTVRENTERPVTVLQGTNHVVGTTSKGIESGFLEIMNEKSLARRIPDLWDGNTAKRIMKVLEQAT
jgi:UDP-N-acetylglucosamine 2-epimerase (non-hydrolysing)